MRNSGDRMIKTTALAPNPPIALPSPDGED